MLKIQEIREIIKLIDQSSIHEFSFEHEGSKLKLKKQQQKNVLDSFERIEKRILDKYGEKVSFEIRFDDEHRVNYNG